MKRFAVGLLALLVLLSVGAASVSAAADTVKAGAVGPYEGTFQGVVRGDRGTQAPLALVLTHRGSQVEGKISLGKGLYVDGGYCGAMTLPAAEQVLRGQTLASNPKRLVATPTFDAGGFDVTVRFDSNVASDGKSIAAKATIDLPWFCGRDPVLTTAVSKK